MISKPFPSSRSHLVHPRRATLLAVSLTGLLALPLALPLPAFGTAAAATPPPEVLAAAETGLAPLLSAVSERDLPLFGFDDPADLASVALGDPLPVGLLEPDVVLGPAAAVALSEAISPLPRWLFPVQSHGRWRVLLTVAHFQGRWQAVDLGGAALATQLQRIHEGLAAAHRPEAFVVRSLQAGCVFLADPLAGNGRLLPLPGTARVLGLSVRPTDRPHELGLADAVRRLAPLVRHNLAMHGSSPERGGER